MGLRIDRVEKAGVLIVGAGIAGLSVALNLPECTLLTRGPLGQGGSTAWAQGGIAAAVDEADSAFEHAKDTLKAGAGIVDRVAAEVLTQGGKEAIAWLEKLGAEFDYDEEGELALSREGGHGRRRVVHAEGDATGAEILRALTQASKKHKGICFLSGMRAIDLAHHEGAIVGVFAISEIGENVLVLADAVILATGGAGRVYSHTTNPPESNGDGIAIAARAGADLADMEFVQFHPTALDAGLDPMPLLTEALRGEGATLLDHKGTRFMVDEHPDAELAPRDIVARAIWKRLQLGRRVFLDVRQVFSSAEGERFALCRIAAQKAGLDPHKEPLPVSPAAHYLIGGIAVDLEGRSSLPGLWAVGETTSTGVHGANRLASNSLLEGVVFGMRTATAVQNTKSRPKPAEVELPLHSEGWSLEPEPAAVRELRRTMWEHVGLVRDATSLQAAIDRISVIAAKAGSLELRNLSLVGLRIAQAALERRESRGTHFRSDCPHTENALARRRVEPSHAVERFTVSLREVSPT